MNSYEVEQMNEQAIKDILGWAEDDADSKVLCAVMALCAKVAELRQRVDGLEATNAAFRQRLDEKATWIEEADSAMSKSNPVNRGAANGVRSVAECMSIALSDAGRASIPQREG